MTDKKEEDPTEIKTESLPPTTLNPDELEWLLTGCIWEIISHIRKVALKELSPDEATEMDDAIARHLARTLMGENEGFDMQIPFFGEPLIEKIRERNPELLENIPEEVDSNNPRALMVHICREFLGEVYGMLSKVATTEGFNIDLLKQEVTTQAALWRTRLTAEICH